MYLLDTNMFLEILLDQERKEECKNFLNDNLGDLNVSDFSLHSIGVVLYRYQKDEIFQSFIKDILPKVDVVNLPIDAYSFVEDARKIHKLDFDDSYQYGLAHFYDLVLVSMDQDFRKIDDPKILLF